MISTPKQRQLIGFFRKLLKFDDDTYKEIISFYGVNSSTELSYSFANELIDRLRSQAVGLGLYVPNSSNNFQKYNDVGYRRGMATPKQLRYINYLWKTVSNQPTDEAKDKALNSFLFRITGKERVNFLTQEDVSKVLKAIKTMQKRMEDVYAASY